jgi:PIN domain nuclease of toxin-antitoxin system
LLDTGVWLRAVNGPQTIPDRVLRVLQTPGETFGLAAISVWDVGKKVLIGKLVLPKDLAAWFADALAANIAFLPPGSDIVTEAMRLPAFHTRDPADELVVATARLHALTLVTTDTRLKGAGTHASVNFKPREDVSA